MAKSASHDFYPIVNEAKIHAAYEYISSMSTELAVMAMDRLLIPDVLSIYAQSWTEYSAIGNSFRRKGGISKLTHEPAVYIDTSTSNESFAGNKMTVLGVRKPDVKESFVGYSDYPVSDDEYTRIKNDGYEAVLEITTRLGKRLLKVELTGYDVRGFIVRKSEHH